MTNSDHYVCLDGTPAKRSASDAEVEAMEERLWGTFQAIVQPESPVPWSTVLAYGTHLGPEWEDKAITVFRAMARVALDHSTRTAALEAVAEAVLDRASIEDDPALIRAAAAALGRGENGDEVRG